MSTRSSFYVTLPSNGSKRFYKENTASVFRNQLAQPLELQGQWEVALVEVQYPITWRLLKHHNNIGVTFFHADDTGLYKLQKKHAKFKLESQFLFGFFKA